MGSKKKMLIAIGAFAMIILAVVVAVIAVLAAQQVSIKSQVNISYTADASVKGSVSAIYKTENGTEGDLGSAPFNGGEANNESKNLQGIPDLKFEAGSNDYIDFTFTFVNDSTNSKYTATLAFTDGSTGNGQIVNMNLQGRLSTVDHFSDVSTTDLTKLTEIEVPSSTTVNYILRVSLASSSDDAYYVGTMLWNLVAERNS